MAFRGHALGVVTTAALLLALSGCGDDSSPEPDIDPTPTEQTSASEPTDTAPTTDAAEPFDAEGGELHRATVKADDDAERAVAEAWLDYWQVRITAYHEAQVDAAALGEVAQGDAVQEVVDYVAQLQADGDHVVGDTLIGISDIEIRGDFAAVKSCFEGQGHLAGTPPYDDNSITPIVGTLAKVGATWVVQTQLGTGDRKCKP